MLPIKRVHNFGTYFVTANCASKRAVFQVSRNAELFFEVLQHSREHYKLHAFVIMPDHFHLLLTPQEIALERCLQLVKGGFSRRYRLELGGLRDVWQKGYADHRCRDREDFLKHKTYIEQNPVRLGWLLLLRSISGPLPAECSGRRNPSAAKAVFLVILDGMAEAMPLPKEVRHDCVPFSPLELTKR